MVKKLIMWAGIGLFLYGATALGFSFIYTDIKVTLDWYKQVMICMVSGVAITSISHYIDNIISFIVGLLPKKGQTIVDTTKTDKVTPVVEVKNNDQWSFLEVNYDHLSALANQLTKTEDKELCRQLQKRLLEIHHEATINTTATV